MPGERERERERDDSRSGAGNSLISLSEGRPKSMSRTYREDDAPVGDGSPEVGRLGAHWAVQERLERRRHGWPAG